MSARTVIDSLEFARTDRRLAGKIAIAALKRLQDSLHDVGGGIDFVIRGGRDERQRPLLIVEVSGVLHLACQRCLGPLEHKLAFENSMLLSSAAELAADADADGPDRIEASAQLDVVDLIEDEILLALPYAPRHEVGHCRPAREATAAGDEKTAFARLAALKRNQQ